MNHKKTISFIAALSISTGVYASQIDGGAVLGSALGAAAGSAVGSASGGKNGAIIGGGVGGALGAAVGSRDTQERGVYVDQRRDYDDHGHRKHHDEGNHYGERKHGHDHD